MEFKDMTVVVTGSARGIGKRIAEMFAIKGANVILSGTSTNVFKTEEEFKEKGYIVKAVQGDISKVSDADGLIATAVETFGTIDILVNNAGITGDKFLIKMDEEDWDKVMDINLKGTFLCTKAAAKVMMKKRKGSIINITSVVGVMGNASQSNYAASKAGMIGFTKSIAKELAPRGITCNAIAPGAIETEMFDVLPQAVKENYLTAIPLKRFGTPEEVAEIVCFISSEKAKYITGQVIHIDGGMVM